MYLDHVSWKWSILNLGGLVLNFPLWTKWVKKDIFIHSYEGEPFLDNFHRFSTGFVLCVLDAWRFWSIQLGTQCWKWNSYLRRITATVEWYKNGLTWLFRLSTNHFGSLWITWKKSIFFACKRLGMYSRFVHRSHMLQCNSIHDGWKFHGFFGRSESRCSVCLYHADRPEGQVSTVSGANGEVGWLVVALCFLLED